MDKETTERELALCQAMMSSLRANGIIIVPPELYDEAKAVLEKYKKDFDAAEDKNVIS